MGMEDTWCKENKFDGQETHAGYGRTLENNPCGWEAIPKSALDIFSEPTGCCDVAGDDNPSHSLKLSLDR